MNSPIYLALDFPDWETSKQFLEDNDLAGIPVKVGMELFYKEGPEVINRLKADGHEIFLDLKLHDIPHTVNRAMKNLASLNVDIVNIHASGGERMIQAAKEGLIQGSVPGHVPVLLGVTVLTSFNEQMYHQTLQSKFSVQEMVLHLAESMRINGGDGIVCSSWEAGLVKKRIDEKFLTMCPGIRLNENSSQDQQRVATPGKARKNGAEAIVIGRSITGAENPHLAWKQAEEEWYRAIKTRID